MFVYILSKAQNITITNHGAFYNNTAKEDAPVILPAVFLIFCIRLTTFEFLFSL
jgi:hypothetical protein